MFTTPFNLAVQQPLTNRFFLDDRWIFLRWIQGNDEGKENDEARPLGDVISFHPIIEPYYNFIGKGGFI